MLRFVIDSEIGMGPVSDLELEEDLDTKDGRPEVLLDLKTCCHLTISTLR